MTGKKEWLTLLRKSANGSCHNSNSMLHFSKFAFDSPAKWPFSLRSRGFRWHQWRGMKESTVLDINVLAELRDSLCQDTRFLPFRSVNGQISGFDSRRFVHQKWRNKSEAVDFVLALDFLDLVSVNAAPLLCPCRGSRVSVYCTCRCPRCPVSGQHKPLRETDFQYCC